MGYENERNRVISPAMRLTPKELSVIKKYILLVDPQAKIYLFGSGPVITPKMVILICW
jgi:hypothetical protein